MANPTDFDGAITNEVEDVLGRWPLAREIFALIRETPATASVRIGIYGEWGVGKTSVLNLIATLCEEEGLPVVRFNPWHARSGPVLWEKFFSDVEESLKKRGVVASGKSKAKAASRRVIKASRAVTGAVGSLRITESLGARVDAIRSGLDWLEEEVASSVDDLTPLLKQLQGKRVVVLIDDLDRTDVDLVPQILQALKDVIDLPGFAFVLAFDRLRVAAALKVHNPALGSGTEFLDKIIEFPRWLSMPPRDTLLDLAFRDLERYAPFVPVTSLRAVAQHLPTNPRTLRLMIRGLIRFRGDVERYDPEEVNWSAVLLLESFRARWPEPGQKLVDFYEGAGQKLERLAVERDSAKRQEVYLDVLAKIEIAERQVSEASLVLDAIVEASALRPFEQALMFERSAAYTRKEFVRTYSAWLASPGKTSVQVQVSQHAEKMKVPEREVFRELFRHALDERERLSSESVNARELVNASALDEAALNVTRLLRELTIDLDAFNTHPPTLVVSEHFEALWGSVWRWSLFNDTDARQRLRSFEAALMKELVAVIGDAAAVLTVLSEPIIEEEARVTLMNELKNIARARVAENIASMIGVPSEMQAVLFKNSSFVERDVVADKDSPLWFGLLRARCLSILRSGTAAVQESAYYLLNSREVQMNLTDSEVLLAMWDAATHGPLNPRFAGELKKVAQWLKAKTGTEVEMPKSWDRLVVGS